VKKVVLSYNSASPTLHPTSQPSVHRKPSSDSAPGLSGGGLIGVIVAAAVVFLLLILLVALHLYSAKKPASQIIPVQAAADNFFHGVSEENDSSPLPLDVVAGNEENL
jgi:hypothetical protein